MKSDVMPSEPLPKTPTFDEVLNGPPGRLVAYYLMSCYLYYIEDKSKLTDTQFDKLAKKLLERWDEVEHPHKHLISREDLEAGTGYGIKEYPLIVQHAALNWLYNAKKPTS